MILHIDMDAFFASIEQAINPRLKGKPLIVGSRGNRMHTVVCAASYEAKAFGINSGMPTAEAFKLCPGLAFIAADQSKYIWISEQVFEMLEGYGYELNYVSIDEFQLDIDREEAPAALAEDIQKRIKEAFRITASVGIAKNCLLAKLASKINKPGGIAFIREDNLEKILAKIPVNKLSSMGGKYGQIFYNLGIQSCLDLYSKSPEFLQHILGKNGITLYSALHMVEHFYSGKEDSKPKSIGHSYTFPRASENPWFIRAWIRLLSEMVSRRLRQGNLLAYTVHIWLNGPEMADFGAQKTFQQATDDGYEVFQKALKIMSKKSPQKPKIRALGISCSNLIINSYSPLFKEEKKREDLIETMDSINSRYGDGAINPAITLLTRKMLT